MTEKISEIEKLRDEARKIVQLREKECTLDPIEVEARLTESVLNKVIKILKEKT